MDVMTFFDVCSSYLDSSGGKRGSGNPIASGYFVFSLCAVIVYRVFSDLDFSSIYTLGMALQCLAFYLLTAKVDMQRSVSGISAKALKVYVMVFATRLCSTMFRNGYLPVDQSGDWVFQTADILSLFMAVKLLRRGKPTGPPTRRSMILSTFFAWSRRASSSQRACTDT